MGGRRNAASRLTHSNYSFHPLPSRPLAFHASKCSTLSFNRRSRFVAHFVLLGFFGSPERLHASKCSTLSFNRRSRFVRSLRASRLLGLVREMRLRNGKVIGAAKADDSTEGGPKKEPESSKRGGANKKAEVSKKGGPKKKEPESSKRGGAKNKAEVKQTGPKSANNADEYEYVPYPDEERGWIQVKYKGVEISTMEQHKIMLEGFNRWNPAYGRKSWAIRNGPRVMQHGHIQMSTTEYKCFRSAQGCQALMRERVAQSIAFFRIEVKNGHDDAVVHDAFEDTEEETAWARQVMMGKGFAKDAPNRARPEAD